MIRQTGKAMKTVKTTAAKKTGSTVRRLLMATASVAVMAQTVVAPGVAQAHTDALGFLITPSATTGRFDAQIFYGSWHSEPVGPEGSVILSRNGTAIGTVAFAIVPGFVSVPNGTVPAGLIPGTNYFVPDGMGGLNGDVQYHGIYAFQSATFTGLDAGSYTFAYAPGPLSVVWTPSNSAISNGSFTITSSGNLGNVGGTVTIPNIDTAVTSYTTTQLNNGAVNPVFSGGTLAIQSGGTVTTGFTVEGAGGTIDANGQNVTFSGTFADAGAGSPGSLTLTGSGTVTFSGANTFTGDIYVDGAVLGLGTTTGAGTGTIHMVDPQIDFNATGTYVNDISLEVADGQQAADPTILNNASGGDITLSGRIYETAGVGGANQYVTFAGSGTTFLTNETNNWGGVTTINGGVTLSGTTGSISGGSIVNNGALVYTNTSAGTANQDISGSGTLNVTGTGPVTLNGDITSSGQVSVSGAGSSLTLGGARSNASNSGVLLSGSGATLSVADTGSIQSGGFLGVRVTGANTTINNLGTIQNSGVGGDSQIGAAIYVDNGVQGGVTTVNNGSASDTGAGSVIRGYNAGVRHGPGSTDTLVVNNHGHIIGDIYNGIENSDGGLTVNNFNGGYIWTLIGSGVGSNSASAVSVTNAGVIGQNVDGSQIVGSHGVYAVGGLTVNNQAGGLIVGQQSGVTGFSTLNLTNSGTIEAVSGPGVSGTGLLTLTNNAGGVISGGLDSGVGVGVLAQTAGSSITNAGRIDSGNTGVQIAGGTINNQTGGVIIAAGNGVYATGGINLTNAGTIQGSSQAGVNLQAGGTVQNQTGGQIIGSQHGILGYGDLNLTNAGSISGGVDSVNLQSGGSLTLTNTGTISTPDAAAVFVTGSGTVTNSGTLAGGSNTTFGAGFSIYGSGDMNLTNQAGGQITGHMGVRFDTSGTGLINNAGFINAINQLNSGVLTINNLSGGTVSGTNSAIDSANGGRLVIDNAGTVTGNQWGVVGRNANDSITNSGLIRGVNQQGVILAAGGTLNNQATGVIRGANDAVQLLNTGSVTNAGQIDGGNGSFQRGIYVNAVNSTINNQTGGSIDGWRGVELSGGSTGGTVTNTGTITGTGSVGVLFFSNGGTLNNNNGGVISGLTEGVYGAGALTVNNAAGASITSAARDVSTAGTLNLTNGGQIHGGLDGFEFGVIFGGANSTVTNQSGGVIDGWRGVQVSNGASNATINNAGRIESFGNYGVITFATATVNNLAGGLITSNIGGVYANGFALNLNNAGTITGGQYNGVTATVGGTINNLAGGVINAMPAGGWGIFTGGTATVSNAGTINADSGVVSAGTSNLTNTGLINGTVDGLLSYNNGVFNVTNSGTISANTTTGRGMNLAGAGNIVVNQSGGVISGWRGIELASNATNASITNAGSITATTQGVLSLANGTSFTNSGTITGGEHGFLGAGVSTVTNQAGGVMTGNVYNAVYTGGAGSVIANAGLMNGGNAGVYTDGANTSLTNTGTIRVTGTTAPTVISGVYMSGAGSSVTNAGTIESTLTDGRGVYLSGGTGTITNQSGGVISGNGNGAAIILTGADYTVDLQAGSTVNGLIDASLSSGHNVLTVAGAANGGYAGGSGADDITLVGGMTVTGVLNGMDGVDSLVLAGSGDGALDTSLLGGFESRTLNGTGTWTLSGVDGDTSNWTLNSGVLSVTGNQAINNAAGVTINAGATLNVIDSEAIGALSGTGSVTVANLQTLFVGADDSSSTFDGVISGQGGLTHLGTGVLTLTGANTYAGQTTVSAGTLRLGASGVIADSSNLLVSSGATLDLQAFNETVGIAAISGTLNGTGTLTGSEYQLNGATVNANLGAGNLFNTGGVSTLNGTAASANVRVQGGTLVLGAANRLNDSANLTIDAGATFDLDGHNETVGSAYINGTLEGFGTLAPPPMPVLSDKGEDDGRQVLPGVGTGTLTAGQYVLNGATINGNLGAGNLFNIGGLSTLTGTVGAGNVTVQAGTLRLEAAERLSNSATLTVDAGATFDLYGHNETVNLAIISGTLNGLGTTLAPIGWSYDKSVDDLIERLPGFGTGTLTASQYQLNAATINGNLGAGTLFNVSGLSILNGTAGANAVSVLAGALRLGAANRLSDGATVSVSSGATLDLQSFSDTVNLALLNGTLAGTGTLTAGEYQLNGATVNANLGTGNLFNTGGLSLLNGTSNAGNVSVLSGTLRLGASDRINNAADLSVSTGATFDLNGNMETVRGLFGSGNVTVGAGRLTFGGVDSGFNGVLSGAGSVVHTASIFSLMNSHTIQTLSNTGGELRFLNASTTGNVNVSGGSLTGAGTIGGALTVSNGATLSPGLTGTNNGIGGFGVGSLVMNGGRLSLDVLGRSGNNLTDVIQVTGNANLTGGTLAPVFHGPVTEFNFQNRYLFLTAGSRTGTFANGSAFTADPGGLAGLYWRLRYDLVANGVVMELRQLTNFTGADGTTNQNQVAGGLSEGQLEASDDWANVLSAFAGLDRDDQLAAFDSAGGEAIADMSTSLFNVNDAFLNAVRKAGASLSSGGTSMNFASTLGFIGARQDESGMTANVLAAFDPAAEGQTGNRGWVAAYAGDSSLEGKPGQADLDTRLNGLAGGWATTQGNVTVGVAAGVTRVEGDVDQRASSFEGDVTHGGAFMRFDNGAWAAGVTGSLYGGQMDSARTVTVGALTGVAVGSTDVEGQSISASVSRRFHLDGDTLLAFGAETTASRITIDGFTETGAGGLSLEVTAQSREWLTTVLSGRINRTYRLNGRDFGLYGGLGAMLTTGDRQALADMRFSGAAIGFGDFTIEGAETAPVAGVADLGFEAEVSDSATFSLGYRGVFNERLDDHQVGARIQIRW